MAGTEELIYIRMKLAGGAEVAGELRAVGTEETALAEKTAAAGEAGAVSGTKASRGASMWSRAGKVARIGALALAGGITALGFAAKNAITRTQDLAKTTIGLNQNLGIGVKRASEWGSVLQARGVDSQKAGMAFKTFASQVDSAAQGSATAQTMFKRLGISQDELAKGQKNVQGLLFKTADGINNLGAGTARTTAESKLFGRGWATVAPLMRDGSASLKDNLDVTEKYGAYLSTKGLAAQEKLLGSLRESKIAWQGMQIQLAQAVTPIVTALSGQFQHMAAVMADPRLSSDEKFQRIAGLLGKDFQTATNFVLKLIPQLADKVGEEAPVIAIALVHGFLAANVWGQLALGTWLVTKLGLGSTVMRAIGTRAGKQLGIGLEGGLAIGLAIAIPVILNDALQSIFPNFRSQFAELGGSVWSGFKRSAVNSFHAIGDAAKALWGDVKSGANAVWDSLKSTVGSIVTSIANRWGDLKGILVGPFNAVKNAIVGAFDFVKSKVQAVLDWIGSIRITKTDILGVQVPTGFTTAAPVPAGAPELAPGQGRRQSTPGIGQRGAPTTGGHGAQPKISLGTAAPKAASSASGSGLGKNNVVHHQPILLALDGKVIAKHLLQIAETDAARA